MNFAGICDLINDISNNGKLYNFSLEEWTVEWWKPTRKATYMWGLTQTRYTFLDPGLFSFREVACGHQQLSHAMCGDDSHTG
jgi:hypothetical protein